MGEMGLSPARDRQSPSHQQKSEDLSLLLPEMTKRKVKNVEPQCVSLRYSPQVVCKNAVVVGWEARSRQTLTHRSILDNALSTRQRAWRQENQCAKGG